MASPPDAWVQSGMMSWTGYAIGSDDVIMEKDRRDEYDYGDLLLGGRRVVGRG